MKEIHMRLGHSSKHPEQHCFDGDSPYVTGSVENTLVRLLGIDILLHLRMFEIFAVKFVLVHSNKLPSVYYRTRF